MQQSIIMPSLLNGIPVLAELTMGESNARKVGARSEFSSIAAGDGTKGSGGLSISSSHGVSRNI